MTEGDPSVCDGDRTYGAQELRGAIETAKTRYRACGIGVGSVVAVCMPLSARYVITLVALRELGGCIMPVNPSVPGNVLTSLMAAAGVTGLIDGEGTVRTVDPPPASRLVPADAGYVLFTSGSTGKPKGVAGTRAGLEARIGWARRRMFSPGVTRCAIRTDQAFIDSLTEILGAYASGRTLLIVPDNARRDLDALCDFIADRGVEQVTMTPGAIPTLAAVGSGRLTGVRRWILSGEELRGRWAEQLRSVSPTAEIVNSYGSTEVCGDVLTFRLPATHSVPADVPIGTAVDGTSLRLEPIDAVEHSGASTGPAGDMGELWVGGPQVGYYLDSEDDSAHFRRDRTGLRWFKTGDVVRREGEVFYFVGRRDAMVKIRGHRIDLNGVARALESIAGVEEAYVWVDTVGSSGAILRAAAVAAPEDRRTPGDVELELREIVLPHSIPDRLDLIDQLPRTERGKLDARRLAEYLQDRSSTPPEFETGLQEIIATCINRVTGAWPELASSPGQAGVDSLKAVVVADQLSRYLGCRVTALDVLAADSVRGMAAKIPGLQTVEPERSVRRVREGEAERTLILLHPAIGTCLSYFALLERLEYPGTVIIVEQDATARDIAAAGSLDALAEYYARRTAALTMRGTVDVAGYSFGALIAPSFAEMLWGMGAERGSLILLDPAAFRADHRPSEDWPVRRVLSDAGYRELPQDFIDLDAAIAFVGATGGPLGEVPPDVFRHWTECLRLNAECAVGYRPHASAAPTLIIRAKRTPGMRAADPITADADQATASISVLDIDCSHFELLNRAAVGRVASAMSEFLQVPG